MEKIFVAGGGTMGLDIAQVFARAGYAVTVREISDELLEKSRERLKRVLDRLVSKGKLDEAKRAEIAGNMHFTTDINTAAACDFVLEAVSEAVEVKQQVFRELDQICAPETIFATTTSSLSISAIASATKRQERFIGMHFFNPATLMALVEVILGGNTSEETAQAVRDLSVKIGKTPITVKEAPGFVVNKILIPMINEACDMVDNGVASIEDIDTAMKLGANHPMGPLALGDLVGLDVCLSIMDILYDETHDSKYRASPLLRKMVRVGKLGCKTGQGFYTYNK